MSNIILPSGGDDGYQIQRSLRLRASASAYLSRTLASGTGVTKCTWSGWIKLGNPANSHYCFSATNGAGTDNTSVSYFAIGSGGAGIVNFVGNVFQANVSSSAVFRDPSAWYHVVFVWDSGNATSADRCIIYVNGQRITLSGTFPDLNNNSWFTNGGLHTIGKDARNAQAVYSDGYLSEVNFIDGQALTPSSFGQIDPITGVWAAKKYAGTYGTNGFYLNFADNSAATAAAIGKDSSGNGNNWTPNNISVTAGATYDSMIDVPTPYTDGGNGRGNYAVLSPLNPLGSAATLSNANLTSSYASTTAGQNRYGSIGVSSGKWYWEVTATTITNSSIPVVIGMFRDGFTNGNSDLGLYGYLSSSGNKSDYGTLSAYGATYGTGDVIGVALDFDFGTLTFYKNNVSQGVAFSGASGLFFPGHRHANSSGTTSIDYNFGQRPFTYTPPTGFKALNTQNLPVSTIPNGRKFFDATTYTGNGSSQTIVNAGGFKPDLVWQKSRSNAENHALFDAVRGGGVILIPNLTNAEAAGNSGTSDFNSNGFTTGSSYNTNGYTYVGWQWKAGGAAVTNTAGSITSQVSAGVTQGFSVVTFSPAGTGVSTIGHGLGVAPQLIITKQRSVTGAWTTYHASLGNTQYVSLNLTNAAAAGSTIWNNTSPTSSVFTLGSAFAGAGTMVAYCFSEVAGFSKFGSYTGNGSADGPFVFCGFRPRYLLIKCSSNAPTSWIIYDSVRDTYNVESNYLLAESSNAEAIAGLVDFTSNGFKLRANNTTTNNSGYTYIFAAFAENPFKYSLAR